MATKRQYAIENLGLWEGKHGALHVLTLAEKRVSRAIEECDSEFSLLSFFQAQANTMLKVLVEGARIACQPLAEGQQAEVESMEEMIEDTQDTLSDFPALQEAAIVKAVKENGNVRETLDLWEGMPDRLKEHITCTQAEILALRNVNMIKGNAHVADTYQGRKVSPGSRGNSHDLPVLTEGLSYEVAGHKQNLVLDYRGKNVWAFSDNGVDKATSDDFPGVGITSWTTIGRIMRCLKGDYLPKSEEFTVEKGDLSSEHFSKIKAGGIKPLTVTVITE